MPIRITGMNSGLDTEALVSELVSAYRTKTDKYTKAQTKLTWKQDAWKTMSSKTYSFRNKLDSLRFSSAYNLKTTSVSNTTKATITAGNNAVNGTQSLNITSLAKSGYLTGGRLDGSGKKATEATTLSDLGFSGEGSISLNGKEITLSEDTTIKNAISAFKDAGVDASFDAANQRIFVSAKESGKDNDFALSALDGNGAQALKSLGLYTKSSATDALYGQYAKINQEYEKYKSDTEALGDTALSRTDWLKKKLDDYNTSQETITNGTQAENYLKKAADYQSALVKMSSIEADVDTSKINADLAKSLLADSAKLVTADGKTYTQHKDDDGTEYYTSDEETGAGATDPTKYYLTTVTTTKQEPELDKDGNSIKDENGNEVKKDVTTTTRYLSTTKELNAADQNALDQAIKVKTANDYLKEKDIKEEDIAAYRSALSTEKSFNDAVQAEKDTYNNRVAELKQQFMDEDPSVTEEAAAERAIMQADDELKPRGIYAQYRSLEAVRDMTADEITAEQVTIAQAKENAQTFISDNTFVSSYAKQYKEAQSDTSTVTQEGVIQKLESDIDYALEVQGKTDADLGYNTDAVRVDGQDAVIYLNGAKFTSSSNTFSINGLTINALATTTTEDRIKSGQADEDAVTITTSTDNQGIYDKIKDFLSEYNSLINSMTASYNAASASDYEPLTDDEKESMTDSQIEKWEEKGKSAVLRRDTTLSALMSAMTNAMSKSYTINGKSYSLSNFGIKTLGILNAEKNEQNAYHIDGDADDDSVSGNADKLMAAIIDDPDGVMEFFQKLSSELYDNLGKKMTSTSMRTYGTFYNDKEMAKEYSDYTTTISKWEEKVSDIEDSYYKKFAAMESALSKLQSQTSQLSGLLG